MTFAAQVLADLPTFLSSGEFSAVRDVDGNSVSCDLQDDARSPFAAEGIYLSHSTLRIKLTDLTAEPVVTQRMAIDGKQARVVGVTVDTGMAIIRLEWFES